MIQGPTPFYICQTINRPSNVAVQQVTTWWIVQQPLPCWISAMHDALFNVCWTITAAFVDGGQMSNRALLWEKVFLNITLLLYGESQSRWLIQLNFHCLFPFYNFNFIKMMFFFLFPAEQRKQFWRGSYSKRKNQLVSGSFFIFGW